MRKVITIVIGYCLLMVTLVPLTPAQKITQSKKAKEASLPGTSASQATPRNLADAVNSKQAGKAEGKRSAGPNLAVQGVRAQVPSDLSKAPSDGQSKSPAQVPQGVAASVVGSGEGAAAGGTAAPHAASGPIYKEVPPLSAERARKIEEELDEANPTVRIPEGKTGKVLDTPINPPTEAPFLNTAQPRPNVINSLQKATVLGVVPEAANDFVYGTVSDIPTSAATLRSSTGEPSLGNMGNTIFYTGNWYAALSTNGGQSFSYVDPSSTFPGINGGFCCDQLVNHAPNQNMMLWALQYVSDGASGTLRLARAVGNTSVANNQWVYYDFNPQQFGFASGTWMDFPGMTVASTYVYLTSNVFNTSDRYVGCVVWRIPLSELAAGGHINYSYFKRTDVFAPRTTEGAGTTMYWATHVNTSLIRIFHWDDAPGSNIFWDDVSINPYTYLAQDGIATSPDGTNWAGRADSRILGAWVAKGVIGFMWGAKQDSTFPYPYTIVAQFNQSTRALISQDQIWNPQYAWLLPTASVNGSGNLAGMLVFGGGPYYPNSNIWISDDVQNGFRPVTLYGATQSNSGPTRNRWGDYHTVHPHRDNPNTWVAATYYLQNGGNNANAVPRYLWFGRERDFSCSFSLSSTGQTFGSNGGSGSVSVTASSASCNRTATSNESWITITGGASGTGSGTVTFSVQANPTSSTRTGTMTIAGRTFTVTQSGSTACTFSISPTSASYSAGGGSGSVAVTAGSGCSWPAASNNSWIRITSGGGGTGSGTLFYSVDSNTSSLSRTGTMTIAGRTFTVTQAAAVSCTSTGISVGQTVNGTLSTSDCQLTDGSYYDTYSFSGAAGQQIVITMSSSSFDTYLFLLTPDGQVFATDDDGGGGTNSRIPSNSGALTLPVTGTYRILANSFAPGATGSYTLRLAAGVACTSTNIGIGQTVSGTLSTSDCQLTDGSYYDTYSFSGAAGQQIVITMSSSSFDTYLFLLTPDGQVFATDDDGGGGTNSRIPTISGSLALPATGVYRILANSYSPNVVGSYTLRLSGGISRTVGGDFDRDGRADIGIYRPSTGVWYVINSSTGFYNAVGWGAPGDTPAPADYDGDGRADIAIFRPSTGVWYVLNSSTGLYSAFGWGAFGDVPVPGDYDGDGRADIAIFRSGVWYVLNSSTGGYRIIGWGTSGDIPVPRDYDNDGRTDIAIYRPSTGVWYVINSSTGFYNAVGWGAPGDIPVAGDYDGDGRADIAIFRPSTGVWYVLNSSTGFYNAVGWGAPGDTPVPADYDGDGRADIAIFRSGVWYVLNSSTGGYRIIGWGTSGDVPITNKQ